MRPLTALFALAVLIAVPGANAHVAECRDVSAQAETGAAGSAPVPTPSAPRAAAAAKPAAAAVEELTGPRARSVSGALLRSSPVMSGIGEVQPLPDGTPVRLVSPLKNTQGQWWFVTARGVGGGWVRDVELTDYQR